MVAIRIHGAAPELLQADSLPTDELGPLAPQEFVWLSIGPNFVGWLVQMVLSGVALGVFMSYTRSPDWIDDGRTKRWVLITVTILNAIQTAINIEEALWYGIRQKRAMADFRSWSLVDCFIILPQGAISCIVQTFLARRSCSLIQRRYLRWSLQAVFALGIATGLAGALASFVEFIKLYKNSSANLDNSFTSNSAQGIFLGASALVDIGITVVLTVILRREMSGFSSSTDSLLKSLVLLSVRTAAYTSLIAATSAILLFSFPLSSKYNAIGIAFAAVLPSLYVLSVFSTITSGSALARQHPSAARRRSSPENSRSGGTGSRGLPRFSLPHGPGPDSSHIPVMLSPIQDVSSRDREKAGPFPAAEPHAV